MLCYRGAFIVFEGGGGGLEESRGVTDFLRCQGSLLFLYLKRVAGQEKIPDFEMLVSNLKE
jgi:hypothetical protein